MCNRKVHNFLALFNENSAIYLHFSQYHANLKFPMYKVKFLIKDKEWLFFIFNFVCRRRNYKWLTEVNRII